MPLCTNIRSNVLTERQKIKRKTEDGSQEHNEVRRKRIIFTFIEYNFSIFPIEVASSDVVKMRICPKELIGGIGDGEGVWPHHRRVDQNLLFCPVHARLSDVRLVAPISPVHVALNTRRLL